MAEEIWKIIFEDGAGGSGGAGSSGGGSSSSTSAATTAATAASVGRFIAPLVGVASVLAFVIQMIRRSKVFSAFMDNFLTVMSSMIDLLFLPLVPVLMPLLKAMMNVFSAVATTSGDVSSIVQDLLTGNWSKLKDDIFKAIGNIGEELIKIITNPIENILLPTAAVTALGALGLGISVAIVAGMQLSSKLAAAILEALPGIGIKLFEGMASAFSKTKDLIIALGRTIGGWVVSGIRFIMEIFGWVSSMFTKIFLSASMKSLYTTIGSAIGAILQTAIWAGLAALGAVFISSIIQDIKHMLKGDWKYFDDMKGGWFKNPFETFDPSKWTTPGEVGPSSSSKNTTVNTNNNVSLTVNTNQNGTDFAKDFYNSWLKTGGSYTIGA